MCFVLCHRRLISSVFIQFCYVQNTNCSRIIFETRILTKALERFISHRFLESSERKKRVHFLCPLFLVPFLLFKGRVQLGYPGYLLSVSTKLSCETAAVLSLIASFRVPWAWKQSQSLFFLGFFHNHNARWIVNVWHKSKCEPRVYPLVYPKHFWAIKRSLKGSF